MQDDWKVTPKLTVNIGLRYEWSTPYTERYNRLQFNDFTADTGISIPVDRDGTGLFPQFGQIGTIRGISKFPTSSHRNSPVDRNNFAPRLGFAYQLASNTVLRGGAGIFYGMNVATNFQYAGPGICQDRIYVLHQRQFRPPVRVSWTFAHPAQLHQPISGRPRASARNHLRQFGAVGLREFERSGHRHGS